MVQALIEAGLANPAVNVRIVDHAPGTQTPERSDASCHYRP
jgi:hypothetical protein